MMMLVFVLVFVLLLLLLLLCEHLDAVARLRFREEPTRAVPLRTLIF